ncbi:trypsin-like peptidase domain-containing protein [Pedobacter sp.]|uniref:trypsin-like peptidase domain-containing protein n=1 Tax=Pedobacter sp. TaxID=1411316 RepID=UPI0031D615A3
MKKVIRHLIFTITILLLTVIYPVVVKAQKNDVAKLEQKTRLAIQKVYPACVRIWGYDTVKKVQTSSQFSGVVVDTDGTILTVSHAIQPNRTYKVRFPDGKETLAIALGKMGLPEMQSRPDLGMMKITEKGTWPFAGLGWSYSLKVNQPCISIAYPETLNQLLPTVRFGKINSVLNEWGFIESSCKMEPGDSGGPLFDLFGRVVGLHSRCDTLESKNYEVPIDAYRKFWEDLKIAKNYTVVPNGSLEKIMDPKEKAISALDFLDRLPSAFSFLQGLNKHQCILKSVNGTMNQTACATIFDYKGKTWLVSKSSIVAENVSTIENGQKIALTVVARDIPNDLVLLSSPVNIGHPIAVNTLNSPTPIAQEELGTFLISPIDGKLQISVLSSRLIDLPKKFSVGFIGMAANFQQGKAIVSRLVPGGPAANAGIKQGDQVVSINRASISSAESYNAQMQQLAVGDTLEIVLDRGEMPQTIHIVAIQRPVSSHVAEQFNGGKSSRLDGFSNVFVHDAVVRPEQCGSPVFDRNGNFYGINIARYSRTSVIVMPVQKIVEMIKKVSERL